MTEEEWLWLRSPAGQQALRDFAEADPKQLALNARQYPHIMVRALAEQLQLRQQHRDKLGPWTASLLLTRQAASQAASYATARWKARNLAVAAITVIDICAGLGMDALARAAAGQQVVAYELDGQRADLLRHNAAQLALSTIRIEHGDGVSALTSHGGAQLVLCDPDRRASGQRSLRSDDWSPSLDQVLSAVADHQQLLLKLPPAADWTTLGAQLPGIWDCICLSQRHELKEILLHRSGDSARLTPRVLAVGLDGEGREWFRQVGEVNSSEQHTAPTPSITEGGLDDSALRNLIIADPDPAIIRSGLLAETCLNHDLSLVHPLVAFAHGPDPGPDFPGQRYAILASGPWDERLLRPLLHSLQCRRLRISRRHFPWDPPTILKRLKCREGGSLRLFCFRDGDEALRWALGKAL